MSATTVSVDQDRPHDAEELPAGLTQSTLGASPATAKLSEARRLLVQCLVTNRIRGDAGLVDDALMEASESREALGIIRLTRAVRPSAEVSSTEPMFGGCVGLATSPESSSVIRLSGQVTLRRSRLTPGSTAATFNQAGHGFIDADPVGNVEYRSIQA